MNRRETAEYNSLFHKGKRGIVLINVHAGPRGKRDRNQMSVHHLIEHAGEKGLHLTPMLTHSPEEARDIVTASVEKGIDVVLALGGDGTFVNTADAIEKAATAFSKPMPLLVPLGGGRENIFVKTITRKKLPYDIAMDALLTGHPVPVDLGTLQIGKDIYSFYNNAGINLDAQTIGVMEDKHRHNRLWYFYAYNKARTIVEPISVTMQADGEDVEFFVDKKVSGVIFINSGKYAGRFPIINASGVDKKIDIVAADETMLEWRQLANLAYDTYRGNENEHVWKYQEKRVSLKILPGEEEKDVIAQHDGETIRRPIQGEEVLVYTRLGPAILLPTNPRTDAFALAA